MNPTVLRPNATGAYRFLSLIRAELSRGETLRGKRILDCGAGGPVPPLAIFAEQGMEALGIDISGGQLEAARAFIDETELEIDLRRADMREIPFSDGAFDYVYEHFSMCHLSKTDTARAIGEMRRVLKPGGIAFFGVVSTESWPHSFYGEERAVGERWMIEGGKEARHSLFTDEECARLVSSWEVLGKERAVFHHGGVDLTEETWADLRSEAPGSFSAEEWAAAYARRADFCRYVHVYYCLREPSG